MRGRSILCLALLIVVGAVTTACGAPPAGPTAVDKFVEMTSRDVDVDYDRLESPQDARTKSDLIVTGKLVEVIDGVRISHPDPLATRRDANAYATFVVDVDRIVDGDKSQITGGRIYVMVSKNSAVTVPQLAAANPRPRTALVLVDLTSWRPSPMSTVNRPTAMPADARLFAALPDGLWLQGDGDVEMKGLHARPADLGQGWGRVRSIDQFVRMIDTAAPK